jgi:hypothetical protein
MGLFTHQNIALGQGWLIPVESLVDMRVHKEG